MRRWCSRWSCWGFEARARLSLGLDGAALEHGNDLVRSLIDRGRLDGDDAVSKRLVPTHDLGVHTHGVGEALVSLGVIDIDLLPRWQDEDHRMEWIAV